MKSVGHNLVNLRGLSSHVRYVLAGDSDHQILHYKNIERKIVCNDKVLKRIEVLVLQRKSCITVKSWVHFLVKTVE